MTIIINSFAQFMPYIFIISVFGLVVDSVLNTFRGGKL